MVSALPKSGQGNAVVMTSNLVRQAAGAPEVYCILFGLVDQDDNECAVAWAHRGGAHEPVQRRCGAQPPVFRLNFEAVKNEEVLAAKLDSPAPGPPGPPALPLFRAWRRD